MFKFLKSLFSKAVAEEPEEEEKISVNAVSRRFEEISARITDDANRNLLEMAESVRGGIEDLKEAVEKLRNAKLMNPDIPVRAKHFMEGNREAYIKSVEQFMSGIDLPDDILRAEDSCNGLEKSLHSFGKSTERAYSVLQEFFSKEAGEIALKISGIMKNTKKMKSLAADMKIDLLPGIRKGIESLNNRLNKISDIKAGLVRAESWLEKAKETKSEIEQEEKKLKQSGEFKRFTWLEQEMRDIRQKKKEKGGELMQVFSSLETAMKKFARTAIAKEILVNKYLSNPVVALLGDNDLIISDILDEIKAKAENGSIELKDKKRKKTLDIIGQCSRHFFRSFADSYMILEKKERALEEDIRKTGISEAVKLIESKVQRNEADIKESGNRVGSLSGQLQETSLEKIKDNLGNGFSALTGKKVVIS